jgi:hypothetical protein
MRSNARGLLRLVSNIPRLNPPDVFVHIMPLNQTVHCMCIRQRMPIPVQRRAIPLRTLWL